MPWEQYRSQIRAVVIETEITTIAHRAFKDCTNLKSVVMPLRMTRIESEAFGNCKSLTNVQLPYMIDQLETEIFSGCTALQRVILPDTVFHPGSSLFRNCTALTYVGFPTINGIEDIPDDLFDGCKKRITAAGKPGSEAEAFAQRNNCQFKAYTNIRFQDQSVDVTAKDGETLKITVQPVNTSQNGDTLSYQWRYYENGGWRELTWAGSKSATLSIPVDASRENRIYSCWVYTGSGSIALSPHKKVNFKAAFTQQPKSTTQIIGTTAVFTAKASGNAAKTVSGTATLTVK